MVNKYTRSQPGKRGRPTKYRAHSWRSKTVIIGLHLVFLVIVGRLFYWQILEGSLLKAKAKQQYDQTLVKKAERGRIYTAEGQLLVGNTSRYRLVAYPFQVNESSSMISNSLTELVLDEYRPYQTASASAEKETIEANLKLELENKLKQRDDQWVSLLPEISLETKNKIEQLNITGLGFEPFLARYYPEASMAAHVTGFVGKNEEGQSVGYFGLEGGLDQELSGQNQKTIKATDIWGLSLFSEKETADQTSRGRDIVTTIKRNLQYLAETTLEEGLDWTGAKAGEIVIIDPQTGRILALASLPQYNQAHYQEYEAQLYKNPSLTDIFEPGSVFKPLTVAAGIEAGVITPETQCPNCEGPRVIGGYTIRTWNDVYHPNITMREALAKSDNVAMIHVAEQLGAEKFRSFLTDFGLDEPLGLDLQEEQLTELPEKWGPVELATRSFGQGIGVTSLELVRAIGAIANDGLLMKPRIIQKVIEPDQSEIVVEPSSIRRVISSQTAKTVTEMMVHAAKEGEAQWIYSKDHSVAGKTGTSQIPDEGGGYKEDATIASYVGFAPPEDPQFVMLVKLIEPQSSPWAAETAAPIWYKLAKKLFISLKIPADNP